MNDPEWLTPEEAAALLQVSTKTIYRGLNAGTLPGGKVGNQWRIPKADLEASLKGANKAAEGGARR